MVTTNLNKTKKSAEWKNPEKKNTVMLLSLE